MQLGVLRFIQVDLKLSKMKSGTRSSRIQNYQNAPEANAEQIVATLYSTLKGRDKLWWEHSDAPDFDEEGKCGRNATTLETYVPISTQSIATLPPISIYNLFFF